MTPRTSKSQASTARTTRVTAWNTVRDTVTPGIRPSRLLLALKTAIAVGLAWPIAQLMPGAVDDYSYYAPLGALLSMMPTLVGSLRTSAQTVLGIALGIGLAWLVLITPLPYLVSVPLAVGIGVAVGGIRGLGAGRDYVAIAAMFVLLIGGTQADDFSLGFLTQMGVGMVIGFSVNLLVFPPLRFREATAEVRRLRDDIADTLDGMAAALTEQWPPDHADWHARAHTLDASIRAAEPVIVEANESSRFNPRTRFTRQGPQPDIDDLRLISELSHHTRELSDTLSSAIWADPITSDIPPDVREPLSAVMAATADALRAWDEHDTMTDAARTAHAALTAATRHDDAVSADPRNAAFASAAFTLERMITAITARNQRAPR